MPRRTGGGKKAPRSQSPPVRPAYGALVSVNVAIPPYSSHAYWFGLGLYNTAEQEGMSRLNSVNITVAGVQ